MNLKRKKTLLTSSMIALSGAIFLTSLGAVFPTAFANAATEFNPTISVTYADGAFSSSNTDYTVTPTESGITADTVIKGGWNFSTMDSYVAITAKNDKPIATQSKGITVTFQQRMTVEDDTVKTDADPDAYEQILTVEGANGETAHICAGGLYYIQGTGVDSVFAQSPTSHKGMLTTEQKHITVAMDFENDEIYVYFDGEQAQKYISTNSKYANIVSSIDTFEKVLTQNNSTLYLRKVCENKASRNSTSFVMGDVAIHNSVFTADQAAEYYESLSKEEPTPVPQFNVPIKVDNLTENDFVQTSSGVGFENNTEREGAFRFTDLSSYLTITANEGKKFVSQKNGISFHFYQRAMTDVYYQDEGAERPNVVDDFEQLFSVQGANGELAYICTGGLYYVDAEGTRTYAQPSSGIKSLLNKTWKYVSIVVDNVEMSISVYVDGERAQYFSPTANKAAVTANVVNLFSTVAYQEGGTIYLRKSCPKREERNTTSQVLDDIIIGEGSLSQARIHDYYDAAIGNARVRFTSNMQGAEIPDLVLRKGEALTVDSIPVIDGYNMEGLFADADHTQPVLAGTAINASQTVYVKYSLINYTITYHGATVEGNPTAYTVETNGVTILDAQKEGYTFDGWYRTAAFENQTTYLVPGSFGNVDLYAKFTPIVYTVTYVQNGGVFESTPVEEFTVETADFTPANVWKAHYTFDGWYSDGAFTTKVPEIDTATAANVTLYAKFVPVVYSINYNLNGGTLAEGAVTSYTVEDESVTLVTANKTGYTFDGWYSDEVLETPVTQIDVANADDVTLYAKYTAIVYTVEYVVNGGTLAEGAVNSYTVEDESVTLVTASKTGYTFDGWYSDDALETPVNEINSSSATNITLYAKYTAIVYTVEYVVNGGTLAEGAVTSYTVENETFTLVSASKQHYMFDGWYSDEALQNAITQINPQTAANVTLYAKFTPVTYTVDYVLNGGTLAEGAVTSYTVEDGKITLVTAKKEGYEFDGWYFDEAFENAVTEIDASNGGNITLYAKYTQTATGCSSVIGSSAISCVTLAFAVVLLRKKRGE